VDDTGLTHVDVHASVGDLDLVSVAAGVNEADVAAEGHRTGTGLDAEAGGDLTVDLDVDNLEALPAL